MNDLPDSVLEPLGFLALGMGLSWKDSSASKESSVEIF